MLLVISLMLPFLFGLGTLFYLVCGNSLKNDNISDDAVVMQSIAICFIFGVQINHFLVLLFSNLSISLMVGCALSIVTVFSIAAKNKQLQLYFRPRWLVLCFILYVACILIIANEPVSGWDARSIWFFHAKMIYYNNSIDAGGDWALPSIRFSHTDYPQLVPILAAQIAYVAGYWNEYLPKLSLVALLLPAILFTLSILNKKWWHVIFIVVPLFFLESWLINGYMDGYLAIYAGFGCFYFGRWLDQGKNLDLYAGVLSLGIVLNLKNEGMLYALVMLMLLCCFLLSKKIQQIIVRESRWWEYIVIFSVSVSGVILWARKKQLFDLKNDLQLGLGSLEAIQHRLSEGALLTVLQHLYVTNNVNLSLGILLLSIVYKFSRRGGAGRGWILCGLVALIYFSGIVTIYLATPYDLISFHLPTGDRTMLPVHIMFLAASLSILYSSAAKDEPLCMHGNGQIH